MGKDGASGWVSSHPSAVSDFKKLKVWRKGHALALNVHRTAGGIRGAGHSSLRSQMVRAALSIPTNIVEGTGQQSGREFGRFIRFALNSASELEYHLIVANDIKAIGVNDFDSLSSQTIEVRKMLQGLLTRVMSPTRTPQKQVEAS
ncbi:MAG: four helix bundle protein [Gemmatimonadaceae bacterium]